MSIQELTDDYGRDGYVSGVRVYSEDEARAFRKSMEDAEEKIGSLHYKSKIHTVLKAPLEMATNAQVLDLVQAIIGPNILLYNATFIIKEAQSASHVSWHQDLTYWGLSHDDQVSMWLALSTADEESGCMRMLPASHRQGMVSHEVTEDEDNVLLQGQTAVQDINEGEALMCPLRPGEASFHHGWTLHASMPNRSNDRRIGLNVQYIATHVKQTKHDHDTAMLVRGVDEYGYYGVDMPATSDLDPVALKRQEELERIHVETAGQQ